MAKRAIIGMGNPLMGDDGVGVRLVEMLREEVESSAWAPPEGIELVSAGADALLAGAVIAESPSALLIDAADLGGDPGDYRFFGRDEVRLSCADEARSAHTLPVSRVLEMVDALGSPCALRLMGVQSGQMTAGGGLSPAVRRRIPEMLQSIKEEVSHLP
jgi:hydrogenase maturation protease